MISISANLNIMIKAVEKASKSIIRDFGEVEKLQVSKKGPYDFVTKTDKNVEKILIEELSKTKKNYSFLTEETGVIKNKDRENIWIIDPIDGTTNFLHGIPHFAICIAHQSKDEIISGLIFDPIKDEMFFAEKDKGAFLNNQRLRVSKKNSFDECLFSSNHEGVKFSNLNMRCSGCAALDLAYVASGRLDGFFHNKINLWDVAAGALLVKEAGGIVNNLNQFEINNINIRASNISINDQMLKNLENFK
jgi:myo-inositol-1(or 4)-monophosphatase